MNYTITTLPRDFDRFPEFRRLVDGLADFDYPESTATHVFIKLWTELGYLSVSYIDPSPPLGSLPESCFDAWYHSLGFNPESGDIPASDLRQVLIDSSLLRKCDDMLHCVLFYLFNEDLHRAVRNSYSLGDEGAYRRRSTKFTKEQDRWRKIGVPQVYFQAVDDQPITESERNRIDVLIRLIDYMYGRPLRTDKQVGVGLVQDACRVVRRFTSKQLEVILNRLQETRTCYKLPRTSEWTLAHIDTAMAEVMPAQGWQEWGRVIMEAK